MQLLKRSGNTYTSLSLPSSKPTAYPNLGSSCAFSLDDEHLAMTSRDSPYLYVWKRTGDTFTALPNLPDLPIARGESVRYSPDGSQLLFGYDDGDHLTIYNRDGDNYTVAANPPGVDILISDAQYSPDMKYIAVNLRQSPYFLLFGGDFPFDAATEFYVPAVDDLPVTPVNTWTPSVSPKAYVRAK